MNPLDLLERLDRLIAAMEALAASNMALADAALHPPPAEPEDEQAHPTPMSRKR